MTGKRPAERSLAEQRAFEEERKARRTEQQRLRRSKVAQANQSASEPESGIDGVAGPTPLGNSTTVVPVAIQRTGRLATPPPTEQDTLQQSSTHNRERENEPTTARLVPLSDDQRSVLQSIENDVQGLSRPQRSHNTNYATNREELSEDEDGPLGAVSRQRSRGNA